MDNIKLSLVSDAGLLLASKPESADDTQEILDSVKIDKDVAIEEDKKVTESLHAEFGSFLKNSIESFYNQSLPQFGWVKTGNNTFIRHGEKLYLTIEEEKEYSIMSLRVEPSR